MNWNLSILGLVHRAAMPRARPLVPCTYQPIEIDSDFVGYPIPGNMIACSCCRHRIRTIGVSPQGIERCLDAMREECPCGDANNYEMSEDL